MTDISLPVRGVTDSFAMIGRSVRHTTRNAESMITSLVLPVMLLLLFVYVFGGAIDTGGKYVDYVVPGIVLLCAGFGASTTAIMVAEDMANGIIDRFRSMDMHSAAVLTGHVTASVARNAAATLIVVGLAFVTGFRPSAGVLDWLGVIGLLLLFVLAISWLAAAIGLLAGTPEGANAFTFLIMFLPYVSSTFVPVDTMPAVLRPIAEHQPVTPVVETLRGLLLGTPVGNQGWIAVAWCAGILAVSYAGASYLFRSRTAK
jgi:ABC-2 type transport system permease protein